MAIDTVRIGIAGCGHAAKIHLERLLRCEGVSVVGLADPELSAASDLAARIPVAPGSAGVPAFNDHRELLRQTSPNALAIFTPHVSHYRPAMD
ncbi:MAG: Gfo/Idh/MocA family oxidoreductase, partial [Isosphaeraceae bacterium]